MNRIKIATSSKEQKQLREIEGLLKKSVNNSKLRKHFAKVLYHSKQAYKELR